VFAIALMAGAGCGVATRPAADDGDASPDASEQAVDAAPPDAAPPIEVIGNSQLLPSTAGWSGNYLVAMPIIVPGDAQLRRFGMISHAATAQAKMALYSDLGGAPGQLLAATQAFPVGFGPNEVQVPLQALPAGSYWLAGVFDGAAQVGTANPGIGFVRYVQTLFASPLPSTFGASTTYTIDINFYVVVSYR
jgi:hypothetical protein